MSRNPVVVHPDDRLERAARVMADAGVRHLPVVDRQGILMGLVSQRDLLQAGDAVTRHVSEIMITDVKTVAPDTYAHEAAYLLLHHKIGCVPVTDQIGKLVGIATESDFVRVAYTLLGGRVSIDQIESEDEESRRL